MSDTTEVAVARILAESQEIGAVCEIVSQLVDPEDAPLAVLFTELFLKKASREYFRDRMPDTIARAALGAYRFLQSSSPEQVDVQVVNPDVENEEGWYAPTTVIRTSVSERPFIVDSIREFLHSEGLEIEHYIYPIMHVARTPEGRVYDVRPREEGGDLESIVHCEVARITSPEMLQHVREETKRRLWDVVRATNDFNPMIDAVNRTIERLSDYGRMVPDRAAEFSEVQAFLRWLRDGGFVFLGFRSYDVRRTGSTEEKLIQVSQGSGLGILRNEMDSSFASPVPVSNLPDSMRPLVEGGPLLIISKTNAESTVHRRARMDYIGIKRLDQNGNVNGEDRFLGLFTSKAFGEDAARIPILRTKLEQILERSAVVEGSHDYKEIITIFNSMPKEELFLSSAEEVGGEIRTALEAYHTHEVRVTLRQDSLGRGATVMVIMPRERFSADVRRDIEAALVERLDAEVLNYHLTLGSGDQARLHFYVAAPPERIEDVEASELATAVQELIRSWSDRVAEGLRKVRPPDEARRLAASYGESFSREYQVSTEPETAVREILELEAMRAEGRVQSVLLWNPKWPDTMAESERTTALNLYLRGQRLVLSDFMPILENTGLRVIAVNPFDVKDTDGVESVIYAFEVQGPDGAPLDVEASRTLLGDTILAVRSGDATNDILNSLVIQAGMAWRQVDVLRTYVSYAFQLGAVPSRLALPNALRKHPEIARILFRFFKVSFDPDGLPERSERERERQRIREEFKEARRDVSVLSDDRALRHLFTLLNATVRTNYYLHGGKAGTGRSGGVPYISLKFACDRMTELVRHRLLYEVWVRSSRMEGIHLRGAKVARGGIRWSDRPDDFRTEVLGLVKTQMVKNAVIVPAGSKGGFVLLRSMPDREAQAEEAKEQYRTLIRGLLDITDNLVDGEAVTPEGVYPHDEPDPYLVVAADKGTAKFSDVANAISADYGFWLGDAFASGGSNGYDHKVVGITARGAWECVKRHFREKGKDIQSEPFTVIGIGDMSGDVFGNGMLLSRQIKLLAAFDHRHVFIDPDPDPAESYAERERMFALGASSWDEYDRSMLSPGGMIVPRGAKEVELSSEARRALGLPEDGGILDGEALVRAVLRAPGELLWNGGIGTYVKASHEGHASVGDPPNDAVRVDAPELRVQVVGEGGNLGLTQQGRIEYALAGGRLNTDALDNSGGVDLSDREVNLKILLDGAIGSGRMNAEDRNPLLEALTDEVANFVLHDNASQSLAVSLDELRARDFPDDFRGLISGLEREGLLDRAAEDLPTYEDLSERIDRGSSLTRPELAVLLSYAKIHCAKHILATALPDETSCEIYLSQYFPATAAHEVGQEHLLSHRLRREIVASQLTNELIDLMGATFINRLSRETASQPSEVVRAWLISARLADHRMVLDQALADSDVSTRVSYRWLMGLARVLERTTRWVLANVGQDESVAELVERNVPRLKSLRRGFSEIVRGADREVFEARVQEAISHGAEPAFARDLMTLRFLDHLLEVLVIGRESGAEPLEAAEVYYRVSELLQLPWLRQEIFRVAGERHWDQRAAQALSGDLGRAHHRLACEVLSHADSGRIEAALDRFKRNRSRGLDRLDRLLEEIQSERPDTLAAPSVVVREISSLATHGNGRA